MSIDDTNFFSYVYSSWLTKYLWKAYRKGITLSAIPDISPFDSCACNIQKFENLWNEELRQRGPTSASLPLVAWRFIRIRVFISCILNACSQIVNFILQTLLLRNILKYSENPERHFFSGMHWVVYIVAFDLLQITLYTWSDIMNKRTALRLKSVCMSLLFKKVFNVNNIAHKSTDEFMNILSKDGQKIYNAVNYGTSIINGPVVVICTVICISIWLSPLALLGILTFLAFYAIQYWLIHLINYCKENANELTRSRLQKTIEVLDCIGLLKINGWEQHFFQIISNIRNKESKWLWKISYVKSLNAAIAQVIPIIAIIITFYMHFTISTHLTASIAFPICVVIIVQMQGIFITMKSSLSYLKDSIVIFNKIKKGLLLDDTSCHVTKPYEASQAIAIVNGTFVFDISKKQNYDLKNNEDIIKTYVNENNIVDSEKQKLNASPICESTRIEILSNITFKAKRGQLIGISGRKNSGKSSLLLAALGQIKMTNGQLMRQGSCAYVGQKAWITSATIKENILFEEVYDAKKYYEAQVVCKLREDIKKLPDGDETEIGEGGLEISEALKQKIALARAFYADRDIYFLDDPLRFIEDKISQEIFEDLIIRALAEKTIIFVTQDLEYLDRCDYMYIMLDGKIAEHGRHKELMRLGKEYALMVKSAFDDEEVDYPNEFQGAQSNGLIQEKEHVELRINDQALENSENINFEYKGTNYDSINEDDVEPDEIKATIYFNYVKFLGGFIFLLPIVLAYIIYAGIGVLSLLRLTWWIEAINEVQATKHNSFTSYKNWYGFCFFLIILGCVIQSFVVQIAATKIADNLHNALFKKLIHAPVKIIRNTSSNKIRNLFFHDLDNVSLSLPSKLDNTLRYTVLGFFTFSVLISTIPWFTNYVVFASILFLFVGKIYSSSQVNLRRLQNTVRLTTVSFLQNSIEGISTIRTFKKENDLLSKFQELVDQTSSCQFIRGVSERWLSIRLQILTTTCLFFASSSIVTIKDEISPAIAGLTFVYLLQVPNIIQIGMKYFSKTKVYFVSVRNICDYLQTLTNENDYKTPVIHPDPEWPISGLIEFDNVQLRFSDDAPLVLDQISFTVNNAEKIGVFHKTENGKGALVASLYRLYELNGGKISIDRVDISKINIKLLRSQLSIIPEDPIFYGTIRFFLDPTKIHSDSEIWDALERMHLKDKVSALASQLYYTIDGKMLSISEKQLLFFTRAFLRKKQILVLEENININPERAALINQVIEKEFSNNTVFIIAQRLRTILSCDKILIIDDNRLLEFDSTTNLFADQNSYLRKMLAEEEMSN